MNTIHPYTNKQIVLLIASNSFSIQTLIHVELATFKTIEATATANYNSTRTVTTPLIRVREIASK